MELQAIQQKIYEIRGQKVMLDFDLAELYQIETKYLKRAVKANIRRFPLDFMFELTKEEFECLRCKNCTSNDNPSLKVGNGPSKRGGTRYMPFAFTEQGVAMLSTVLNSEKAIDMNVAIMRAFIALRKFALQYSDILEQVRELRDRMGGYDGQLSGIYDAIENLLDAKADQKTWENRERIGFKK